MNNTIEIKIECKGVAVGTLGWFNSIIEKSELVIKETKKGTPAMFLKTPTKDGNFGYQWICEKWNKEENPEFYRILGDDFLCLYAESKFNHIQVYSDYPLTPACRDKVTEFIELAVQKYSDWWYSDK